MKQIDIFKERGLYMYWDYDTDGSVYWRTRKGVAMISSSCSMFDSIFYLFEKSINDMINDRKLPWLYTIGYELFFIFDNKKYCFLLPGNTIACDEYYVRKLIYCLRKKKCSKFYFHIGRLD